MSPDLNHAAPAQPDFSQQTFTWDDRHWRVRGLDTQRSRARLRVNLMVTRRELVHLDVLDLYAARLRTGFIRQAAAELLVDELLIKGDLGRILLALEQLQDRMLQNEPSAPSEPPPMTDARRAAALALLEDPQLAERIVQDYTACGLVGQPSAKLVCYLACVSRLLPRPLAVLVRSSSAAGKTALVEATLGLMPKEQQVRISALTAQALYYMGPGALRRKVLAIAEDQGVAEAAYALKLLQSEGRLAIATAEKNAATGRQQTRRYEVEGPVAMLLTSTADVPDAELANRCILLSVDEQPQQTAAIHRRQRAAWMPAAPGAAEAVRRTHQDAQRLLEPLPVIIPYCEQLTFRTDQTRLRRDHAKYLTLIAASALLHQHQRPRTELPGSDGRPALLATLDDLRLANRLARAVLAPRRAELLPGARRLLTLWHELARAQARKHQIAVTELKLTQRQLREALGWPDRTLRRHLQRLVELEYVHRCSAGGGNRRTYRLADLSLQAVDQPLSLNLVDPQQLQNPPQMAGDKRQNLGTAGKPPAPPTGGKGP